MSGMMGHLWKSPLAIICLGVLLGVLVMRTRASKSHQVLVSSDNGRSVVSDEEAWNREGGDDGDKKGVVVPVRYHTRSAHNPERRFEGGYNPMGNYTGVGGEEEEEEGGTVEVIEDNCTHPRQPFPGYNDSCDFVHAECEGKAELFDYLAFVLCDLPKAQPLGFLVMALWLIYLISLLATTVDYFFVPPLNFLSEKLRLSPSVAGVTLMALGNGAPDIFVVFSGISQNDLAFVLGTLTGASIFITTVVLGTVMLVSKVKPYRIDKIDFMRDILALAVVVSTVIGVAFDGAVYLAEACIFPLVYILYIVAVVGLGYFRAWIGNQPATICTPDNSSPTDSCSVNIPEDEKESTQIVDSYSEKVGSKTRSLLITSAPHSIRLNAAIHLTMSEKLPLTANGRESLNQSTNSLEAEKSAAASIGYLTAADHSKTSVLLRTGSASSEERPLTSLSSDEESEEKIISYLPGISWPKRSHFLIKIIWLTQWPISLLRWLTIPSFYHDGYWGLWHYLLASFSPIPIAMLMLIAVKGWNGFHLSVGHLPLPVLLLLLASLPSLLLFLLLRPHRPPHLVLQLGLVPAAFIMSVIWLNIIANEVVSVLRAFGLLLSIDTAILGLTVLALGNCVADWVADTVVTRAGKPEMAFASCFGSPLLSHVLGLSIAMIIKIGVFNNGEPYRFHIHTVAYSQVKLSWVFLGISLLATMIVFPIFKFSPPRLYGVVLIAIYIMFVLFAVLGETGVIPINL